MGPKSGDFLFDQGNLISQFFFQLNGPQDDEQREDAEPDQDAQVDGGEGGGEDGMEDDEDQMAAQGLNFFSITKKTGLFSHFNFLF